MAIPFVYASLAYAQESDGIASEFEAFKLRLQQAQTQNQKEQNKPDTNVSVKEEVPNPIRAESPVSSPLSSVGNSGPLGVAASLPVGNRNEGFQQNAISTADRIKMQEDLMKKRTAAAKRKAFEAGLEQLMPLEPEQIRELLQEFKINREASEMPVAVPKPKTEVKTVSMDPSADPVEVKTSNGYVTTVTILDSTGAPWPIQDVSWAGKFKIEGGDVGSHILRIIPETAHGVGNISIRLVDLITPITFSITTGLDEVHYRLDARIPKNGPMAKTPLIDNSSIQASSTVGSDTKMVKFLEGVPPRDADSLVLNGVDERTKAWRTGDSIYLRTPLTLLSPSWDASVSSADGMNVYSLADAPVLLLSDQGRMVKAFIVNELGDLK